MRITCQCGFIHVGADPRYSRCRCGLSLSEGRPHVGVLRRLWGRRNTPSGHFEAIKRSGDVFKGIKREN